MTTAAQQAIPATSITQFLASPESAPIDITKVWDETRTNTKGEEVKTKMIAFSPRGKSAFTSTEMKYDDAVGVEHNDDPTSYRTNCAKAFAEQVINQVARLQAGEFSAMPDGHMPLKDWGMLTEVQMNVLNSIKIVSIQQLRDMTEAQMSGVPGGLNPGKLRDLARAYLINKAQDVSQDMMAAAQLKIAEQDAKMAKLEAMIVAMAESKGLLPPEVDEKQTKKKLAA